MLEENEEMPGWLDYADTWYDVLFNLYSAQKRGDDHQAMRDLITFYEGKYQLAGGEMELLDKIRPDKTT